MTKAKTISKASEDLDEAPRITKAMLKGARLQMGNKVIREATHTLTGRPVGKRGRPPKGAAPKAQQSLRLSQEVLDYFRATGPGWQARIDDVLKEAIQRR